ncbi:CDP-diacylglycerol--inositol 3-phosphatidyltransferase [Angomonas deanei]|uniref:CDP-diacylglycerol--inositol 3-phosphatidyltransferase n=1 Tax=Angomonas deanei TaxID=59799 RepID=S9VBP6_9TRYP|nr:CDP-diacylglycerol--inositol 3-phosphatidyltransferase [Angomonas deanei]EPY40367.1 CDP-diacylglycerol--inositol 3-phosphatidyltransferase [Angomonas deanei]CAD2221344.1 CDP-alcohol phosphatidyltransferase, putative [Angomonas deanei]|eukprot:EPY39094.1 CDP-diacylglycerol--inositol 3-phosphatidyltransferase [Angomonas deanei]
MKKGATADPTPIFFFVPNLIGYTRILFSLLSFYVAASHPGLFLFLYTSSFVLDAADGMAARALGQCSHFGSILDMLTDRASTAGMLVVLDGVIQPMPYIFTFVLATLLFLDVASHFCRMYASVFVQKESHKDVSDSIFWLLKMYYSKRKFMGLLCVGQEFSYIFLYAWHAYRDVSGVSDALWYAFLACAVPSFLKQVVNVQQLVDGLYHIGCIDAQERQQKKTKG